MQKEFKAPKLCDDRGRAYSWYKGDRYYFGSTGTTKAKKEHKRFCHKLEFGESVAEWKEKKRSPPVQNSGHSPPKVAGAGNVLVATLCDRFLKRERRASKTQQDNERLVIEVLVDLFGDMTTAAFDINCLRAVRDEFIKKRYVRQKINWRIQIVQRIFRWGASYKIVPVSVYQELKTLIPLKKGDYNLPESKERPTVSLEDIEKTKVELSPVFRAMVIVHLRVAGRPTAICEMRIENIDRQTEDLWAITVRDKMDYLEDAVPRIVYLAKPEIDVLLPIIGSRTEGYIFRPADTLLFDKQKRAEQAAKRADEARRAGKVVYTKKTPSRAARDAERAKNPKREVKECYGFATYRNAVYRACDRAGVKRWFPYQLRHTGITLIGLEHGVDAAQHTAGHRDIKTTLRYFHGENEIAKRVALSRNKPATVKSTTESIKSKDEIIADLLQEKMELLEMLVKKNA